MHPVIFEWGRFALPAYGVLMATGALLGAWVFGRLVARAGHDGGKAFEAMIETILVAMIAAKVVGLLVTPAPGIPVLERLVRTGGIWYVGFLTGVLYFAWRGRSLGMKTWQVLDHAAPAVALGHAIGRLGCFLAGCCWGRACDLPWAVTFTSERAHRETGVPLGVPLHPSQLYEVVAEGTMAAILVALILRQRYRFHGLPGTIYLMGYAVIRLLLETLRDDPRGAVHALSTSQLIALVVLAVAIPLAVIGRVRGTLDFTRARVPEGDAVLDRAGRNA